MHVNVAFRGMNGRALVRLASVSEGEARRRATIPSDALSRYSSTFQVVLMEGRRKDGREGGRGEIFRYLGRSAGALNRDESDGVGGDDLGRETRGTAAKIYERVFPRYLHTHVPARAPRAPRRACRETEIREFT